MISYHKKSTPCRMRTGFTAFFDSLFRISKIYVIMGCSDGKPQRWNRRKVPQNPEGGYMGADHLGDGFMGNKIAKGFYYFSYILFGIFVTAMLLLGLKVWEDAEFLFATQRSIVLMCIVAVGAFFLGAFFLVLWKKLKSLEEKKLWILTGITGIFIVVFQLAALNLLEISYLWDGVNVFSSAVSRLKGNGVVELYFSRYANQNGFLAVTYSLLKLGSSFGLAEADYVFYLNVWNMVFMDIAIGLAAAILYKICPGKKAAAVLLFLLLTAWNPFIYLWTGFYYTSILVMPLFLGIVYLVMCMTDKKAGGKWALAGQAALLALLLTVGMRLRQTTVILAIALVLSGVLSVCLNKRVHRTHARGNGKAVRPVAVTVLVFVLSFVLFNAACSFYENRLNNLDTTDTAFPAVHWIMMGLDHGGEYNNSDADYTASFPTHEEKVQKDIELLTARLKHFGVAGISKTYFQKFVNTWVSASNAYPFRLSVCQKYTTLHDYVFGSKKDFVIYYHQIYQVFLLFFVLVGVIRKWRERKPDCIYVLHISFLGTILFHLLWEAGPLYSVSLQIVYFLLAAYGIVNSPIHLKEQAAGKAIHLPFFLSVLVTVLFFGLNYPVFTELPQEGEKRVVNQYLASDNLKMQEGESVSQTFLATRDFNYFNIHLCNHENEKNTARYRLTLTGEMRGIVYEETINAKDILLDSFLMRQFETISIDTPEEFTLTLETLESEGENYLEVIYFQMKDYDPYTKGSFTKNGELLKGDMFLMVSEKTTGAYTTKKRYAATALLILICECAVWAFSAKGFAKIENSERKEC